MPSSKVTFTLAILLVCTYGSTLAKTLSDCQIAQQIINLGFPRSQLNDWVCLIIHESQGSTSVIGGPNADGSHDYGLFQINDRYWCNNGNTKGKGCNIRCQDLTNDNLADDASCAKTIFSQSGGFSAWSAWSSYCQGTKKDYGYCL